MHEHVYICICFSLVNGIFISPGLKRNGETNSAESVQGGKKRKLESKSLDKHWNW